MKSNEATRPVKVLHLIPTLSSGGAERQLVNLVRTTSSNKIDHIVCVINNADFFAGDIRDAGYKVIELKIDGKRPFIRAARSFRKVMAEERPDVIHSWLYNANISSRLAALTKRKIPVVTSLQSADYEPDGVKAAKWNPRKVRVLKLLDQITARLYGTYFAACSDFVSRSYQRDFGVDSKRIETIYNAVDVAALSAEKNAREKLRDEFSLPDSAFVYLNVGRLDPQKNQRLVLNAFAKTSAEVAEAFLLIAGEGSLEAELRRLARDLAIDDRVLFLGRRNDIGSLLELADVFVFPSLLEGLPVALAEAMYKSLPCIASRIEVFDEVIEDRQTGLLVNPSSADELKDAMIKLYRDPSLRKRLGENAYSTASSKFNAALTARQWENLYLRMLKRANA